jgi:hypothetical protein
MNRIVLTAVAALLLGIGVTAFSAPSRSAAQSSPPPRAPYDPFSLQRAANAPPGTSENRGLERRREIHRWLRERVRPPHRQPPRSPHNPGNDDDDRGHGNNDDHDDDDNPGQGGGNHGTGNNGNGRGNH